MAEGPDAPQARGEVLRTVHQALVTARGSTIFESSGRATLFLTTVSSSVVALAFIGQTTSLGPVFYVFAYVILASTIFVGFVTFVRLVQTSIEDGIWARGVGRILHFYVEQDPGLEPYLVQAAGDDTPSILQMYGGGSRLQTLFTTASLVGVVTAALCGVLVALAASQEGGLTRGGATGLGGALFVTLVAGLVQYQRMMWRRYEQRTPSRFPAARASG